MTLHFLKIETCFANIRHQCAALSSENCMQWPMLLTKWSVLMMPCAK